MQPDGVYVVQQHNFSASYEIRNGELYRCAPILRKKFAYWISLSSRVSDVVRDDVVMQMNQLPKRYG